MVDSILRSDGSLSSKCKVTNGLVVTARSGADCPMIVFDSTRGRLLDANAGKRDALETGVRDHTRDRIPSGAGVHPLEETPHRLMEATVSLADFHRRTITV